MAKPVSKGLPSRSPLQKGIRPAASPGAGTTSTRSGVMSVMRQAEAPRMNTSPGRDSYTISSSNSPTRAPSGRLTLNRPRSGMVPGLVTASRWVPERAVKVWLRRSHTRRGRSSPNSSAG